MTETKNPGPDRHRTVPMKPGDIIDLRREPSPAMRQALDAVSRMKPADDSPKP